MISNIVVGLSVIVLGVSFCGIAIASWEVGAKITSVFVWIIGIGFIIGSLFFVYTLAQYDLKNEYIKKIPTLEKQLTQYEIEQARVYLEELQNEFKTGDN